jgi:hypothetical protein
MTFHHATLILATFLCSLVAGLLFAFAVVVMPGIGSLRDRDYIRAFQVIDRVIQNNQPLFMLVWVGSVLALVASVVLAFGRSDSMDVAISNGAGTRPMCSGPARRASCLWCFWAFWPRCECSGGMPISTPCSQPPKAGP